LSKDADNATKLCWALQAAEKPLILA